MMIGISSCHGIVIYIWLISMIQNNQNHGNVGDGVVLPDGIRAQQNSTDMLGNESFHRLCHGGLEACKA